MRILDKIKPNLIVQRIVFKNGVKDNFSLPTSEAGLVWKAPKELLSTILRGRRFRLSSSEQELLLKKGSDFVKQTHSLGIRFNYLINASCMGNREFSSVGYNELMEYLGWINEVGVDTITVTIPLLIEIIRNQFPKIEINVSTINHVKSMSQIEYFRKLGANLLTFAKQINNFNIMLTP